MQEDVLIHCKRNLAFALQHVPESATNSEPASSGVWNRKREVRRLHAQVAKLALETGDLKQENAQLKENKASVETVAARIELKFEEECRRHRSVPPTSMAYLNEEERIRLLRKQVLIGLIAIVGAGDQSGP